ncbi:hypothetical protein D9615_006706 [Tricholomella constricta]|uniref:Ribonuclease H1 N-terminal domain-containing protein n=1 Tax=Tricholomella constricta TaxID=117010 RepID=A0A8H5H6Z2_9AGAR|nr:hypothetical protein D9615_006706 [Tricholomella constricta]
MPSTSDKVNGAAEAPSPLTLSQLLEVLALSGRVRGPVEAPSTLGHDQLLELMAQGGSVSLHVGDATSATTLHATATLPPVAPASSLSGVTASPPSPITSGGASGSGGAAVVAAAGKLFNTYVGFPDAHHFPFTLAGAATIPVPPVRTKVMWADAFAAAASPPAEGSALPGALTPREPIVVSDSGSESEEEEQEAVQNEEEENVAIDVPGRRWYVVTKGREVGVFAGWYATAPLVVSVSGACYARANSRSQAIADFAAALNAGLVSRIP